MATSSVPTLNMSARWGDPQQGYVLDLLLFCFSSLGGKCMQFWRPSRKNADFLCDIEIWNLQNFTPETTNDSTTVDTADVIEMYR